MTEQKPETAQIERVLADHEYAIAMKRGSICACGFIPTVDAGSLDTQQEYHRRHAAEQIAKALGARTERHWGVSLTNGVYETHTEESAVALSGERPASGPAVTCLRTTYATYETPWVEVVTPPGVES